MIDLSEVNDEVFSQNILGEGFAVIPTKGELRAPADGVIKMVFDTKHAVGMTTENGTEVIMHVGLNTVELEGKFFESFVKVGDAVKAGDLLLKFDLNEIQKAGYDCTTPVVVTNMNEVVVRVDLNNQVVMRTEKI